MTLQVLKQSSFYRMCLRPVLWTPIRVHRLYWQTRTTRWFRKLAVEDTANLVRARAERQDFYKDAQEPLVSITTPTYNRAKLLIERTLPSVLAQTYRNIEWLIVGDHCTDETGELLKKINDPRIQFRNLPSRPRYPRNKNQRWKMVGFQANTLAHDLARGTWIAHLDDDDVFTPDHIQKLFDRARAGDYEFVSGRSKIETRPGQWKEQGSHLIGNGNTIGHVSHSTVFYRTYLDRCFAYDPNCLKLDMAGDAYRWRRMLNAGVRAGFVQDVVTLIPLRPGEACRTIFQPD